MAVLGKRNTLSIIRESAPGLYLDGGDLGEILLPGRYIPPNLKAGDKIDVFIYLDSEDRLVCTTETPIATVGEFAHLEVISIHPRVGAFLNWGLQKDLLLPFREQTKPLRVGQKVIVAIYQDPTTGRIAASMRLPRHFSPDTPSYKPGQLVNLLITAESNLGYSAIIENSHRGLLYRDNLAAPLQIGQKVKGYVRLVRPNGQIDLRLDPSGYKRVLPLQVQIIQALEQNHGRLDFDDSSSPEAIRKTFGASKGAFKQALGALYKSRRIKFTNPGIEQLSHTEFVPGKEKPAERKRKSAS